MAVIIGSARIDEHGKTHGGKAGDQTGREVSTQAWYKHSKGWRVFRPINSTDAAKIAQCMEHACRNPHIGYDQYQRNNLYNLIKDRGFNISAVTTDTETDCSALVRVCCAFAGIMLPDFNTQTEPIRLQDSNRFIEMIGERYSNGSSYLKRGDILVTSTKGHTAIVLTDGSKAENQVYRAGVTVTGDSVFLRRGPGIEYHAITILHKGDVLEYVGETEDKKWYLVWYKGNAAWISTKYSKI